MNCLWLVVVNFVCLPSKGVDGLSVGGPGGGNNVSLATFVLRPTLVSPSTELRIYLSPTELDAPNVQYVHDRYVVSKDGPNEALSLN